MGISVVVHSPERTVVEVSPPATVPDVTINRVGLTTHLDDLVDVNVTQIPEPFPGDMNFDEDQRYALVFKPNEGWIAAPEPVVTEIDGGTY